MPLRILIPLILLLTGTANALSRIVIPPGRLARRSWEAVTLFVSSIGPFAPSKHYVNPNAYGDLGTLANLPDLRIPHPETFTTGPQGFRAYDPISAPAPAAILFGDSFGAGASLTDEDYLCGRLANIFHGPVFFAAYYSPRSAAMLPALPKAPYVILQISERYGLNENGEDQGITASIKRVLAPGSPLYLKLRTAFTYWSYSPLEIASGRLYRKLQNDEIFPNVHRRNVHIASLKNGTQMLFLASEVPHYFERSNISAASVVETRDRIERMGYRVLTVLVPNKYTVYYPLLKQPPQPAPASEDLYLSVLERKLRNAGVPVVNLTAPLRVAATQAITRNEYVYRLDDTHWNPAGVAVAVNSIAKAVPSR